MPRNSKDFHTSAEVARALRVHVRTVRRAAAAGQIQHSVTLGGHRRYPSSEVTRLKKILNIKDEPAPKKNKKPTSSE